MAEVARSICDLGQRDHAAADPRPDRDPVLGALDGQIPDRARARDGTTRRRARSVGRPRLLLARAQPQEGRRDDHGELRWRATAYRERAARRARHRPVHRWRDRLDRICRAHTARRWQRGARARTGLRHHRRHQIDRGPARALAARRRARHRVARGAGSRRSQSRLDGARRLAVLADLAEVPALPAREGVHRRARRQAGNAARRRGPKKAGRAADPRARGAVALERGRARPRAAITGRVVRWPLGAPARRCDRRGRERTRRHLRR